VCSARSGTNHARVVRGDGSRGGRRGIQPAGSDAQTRRRRGRSGDRGGVRRPPARRGQGHDEAPARQPAGQEVADPSTARSCPDLEPGPGRARTGRGTVPTSAARSAIPDRRCGLRWRGRPASRPLVRTVKTLCRSNRTSLTASPNAGVSIPISGVVAEAASNREEQHENALADRAASTVCEILRAAGARPSAAKRRADLAVVPALAGRRDSCRRLPECRHGDADQALGAGVHRDWHPPVRSPS
jgi:hypothetical protein